MKKGLKKQKFVLVREKYFEKRKVIFASGFLVIIFAAIILFNPALEKINHLADSLWAKTGLQNVLKLASEKLSVFGQEAPLVFFPRFPQRLLYVTSEISAVSEELAALNEELLESTKECDCKFAESTCSPGKPSSGITANPFPTKTLGSLYEKKMAENPLYSSLAISAGGTPEGEIEKLKGWTEEELGNAHEDFLNELKKTVPEEEWKKWESDLGNLPKDVMDQTWESIEKTIKELGIKFEENPEAVAQEVKNQWENEIKNFYNGLKNDIEAGLDVKAQLNDALNDLKSELDGALQSLKNAILGGSMCIPSTIGVFGGVCPEKPRNEITDISIESDINDLMLRLSDSQKLLKEEMETGSGLEKELATLRPDDAQALRDNLNKLLELGPKLAEPAGKNLNLPNECSAKKCIAICKGEIKPTLKACFLPGEQEPMELKLTPNIALEDLNLGKVGIESIKLNLPDEIQVPPLPVLPSLTISIPDIALDCPTISRSITFQTPSFTLPDIPAIKFSCPIPPSSPSYQCSTSPIETSKGFAGMQWNLDTFSWLSEKCQELPNVKDSQGIPKEEEFKKCFDMENVQQAITQGCDAFWSSYIGFGASLAPSICQLTGKPCLEKAKAEERECKNIFNQEGEDMPSTCNLDVKCSVFKNYCNDTEECYATEESVKSAVETLEQKCEQIKQTGRETIPEPCKFLPIFTGKPLSSQDSTWTGPEQSCPSQTISDYSPAPGCAFALPSIPKIPLSKYSVIIPDIKLPSFSLPPFFYLKLPSLIFEDLILPDIDLCNLDDCRFQFPDLSFKVPTLKIPQIELSAQIDIPGIPQLEVKVAPIQFSSLSFQPPQLNLGNLITAELEMPKIPLPKPKLKMGYSFNFKLLNFLLGLIKMPTGGCWSPDIKIGSLSIVFPDFIFSWPAFVTKQTKWIEDGKEVRYCKEDIRNFCKEVTSSLEESQDKFAQFQNKVNEVFQKEVQDQLDELAKLVQEEIQSEIDKQLKEVSQKIKDKLVEYIAKYAPEKIHIVYPPPEAIPMPGVLMVDPQLPCELMPPLKLEGLPDIGISGADLLDLNKLWKKATGEDWRTTIPIDWPDELKQEIPLRKQKGSSKQPCVITADCPTGCCPSGEKCFSDKKCFLPLEYQLPTIPLSELSYPKESGKERVITKKIGGKDLTVTLSGKTGVTIRLPGFQRAMPSIDINVFSSLSCHSQPPKGGNPCPTGEIESNLEEIKRIRDETQQASQKIIDILY